MNRYGFGDLFNKSSTARAPADSHPFAYYYWKAKAFTDGCFYWTMLTIWKGSDAAAWACLAGSVTSLQVLTTSLGTTVVVTGPSTLAFATGALGFKGLNMVAEPLVNRSYSLMETSCGKKIALKPLREAIEEFLGNIQARNIIIKTADEVNSWWRTVKGYTESPYKPDMAVLEFELDKAKRFVRVYDDANSAMKGQWFMKAEDIAGLTRRQIQDKFALLTEPKYVVDLELPAGAKIRGGKANALFGFSGGGV